MSRTWRYVIDPTHMNGCHTSSDMSHMNVWHPGANLSIDVQYMCDTHRVMSRTLHSVTWCDTHQVTWCHTHQGSHTYRAMCHVSTDVTHMGDDVTHTKSSVTHEVTRMKHCVTSQVMWHIWGVMWHMGDDGRWHILSEVSTWTRGTRTSTRLRGSESDVEGCVAYIKWGVTHQVNWHIWRNIWQLR